MIRLKDCCPFLIDEACHVCLSLGGYEYVNRLSKCSFAIPTKPNLSPRPLRKPNDKLLFVGRSKHSPLTRAIELARFDAIADDLIPISMAAPILVTTRQQVVVMQNQGKPYRREQSQQTYLNKQTSRRVSQGNNPLAHSLVE